jgi:hypothetical protein
MQRHPRAPNQTVLDAVLLNEMATAHQLEARSRFDKTSPNEKLTLALGQVCMQRRRSAEVRSVDDDMVEQDHLGKVGSHRAQRLENNDRANASLELRVEQAAELVRLHGIHFKRPSFAK